MESGESGREIIIAARRFHMFDPDDKVLVAVSGGPDSVAMLHALHTHADEFGISLHIAHINHGLRGKESNIDQEFVRNLGHQFGLPVSVRKVDIPAVRKEMRVGEEEAARIVRYQCLEEIAREVGAGKIAVGHTADDRAESVLLNIIRGTGTDGLGSIRPVRGNIVRPLIETTRKEVEEYIAQNRLPYRVDESNMDVTYARSRVRHELLPLLERDYNPQIRRALINLADIACAESEFLNDSAASEAAQILREGALDAELLAALPSAIQRRIIRAEVEKLKDLSFEQVERVVEAIRRGEDFVITLPSGTLYAERAGDKFEVRGLQRLPHVEPFDIELQIPGHTRIPAIDVTITAEIVDSPRPEKLPPTQALIDQAAITGKLRVRNIRPGDRIVPFGMRESKKLQDVFVDKKIPRRERINTPIVVDDAKIVWAIGVISSDTTKVTEQTRGAIRLSAIGPK
ncbi:MAG: tRNA lysidine(34) synthetase TilS [Armatimonadetes bacterium]|nr:tRNA lysidine(34) synthetase TilS [Armatimonadota bacterium]